MSNLEKDNVTVENRGDEIFSMLTEMTGIPMTCPFPAIEKCKNSDCRYLSICQSQKSLAEKHTEIMMHLLEVEMMMHGNDIDSLK